MNPVNPRRSALLDFAFAGYVMAVATASLHPLASLPAPQWWQALQRLGEWPRFYSYADVVLNVLGYLPFGCLLTWRLRARAGPLRAAGLATLAAAAFSLLLELLQDGIPGRVPSALDVFCNTVGGATGAWIALVARRADHPRSRLARWRDAHVHPGPTGDLALVLLPAWLLAQFQAEVRLFATGGLRGDAVAGQAWTATAFALSEAAVCTAGLVALAGVARCALPRHGGHIFLLTALGGLTLRSAASLALPPPHGPLFWLTPGNGAGLLAGSLLGLLVCRVRSPARAGALGVLALAVACAVAGLLPESPYAPQPDLGPGQQGHLRHLLGTASLLGSAWVVPSLAVALGVWRTRPEAADGAPPAHPG